MRPTGGLVALAHVLTRYLAPALPELERKKAEMDAIALTAAGSGMGPQTLREDGAMEGAQTW